MYGGKLTSVWGQRLTSTFYVSYNTKGGNSTDSYKYEKQGRSSTSTARRPESGHPAGIGSDSPRGQWSSHGVQRVLRLDTSSITMLRGDIMYYKEHWLGSHEFQTVCWRCRGASTRRTPLSNDGFTPEERRMVDPSNGGSGTIRSRGSTCSRSQPDQSGARQRTSASTVRTAGRLGA